MTGNAPSTITKRATDGTPLSIVCKTVGGTPIIGVKITVIGLREKVSVRAPNDAQHDGQNDHLITDDEIDQTRTGELGKTPDLPEGECDLNILAVAPPDMKLGAATAPFVENGTVFKTIRLRKGAQDFSRKTPLVLTLTTACLNSFVVNESILKKRVRNLTLEEAYQELIHHHKSGTITLFPEPVFDDSCTPIVPKQNMTRKHTVAGPLTKEGKPTRMEVQSVGPDGKPLFITAELVNLKPRVDQVKLFYTNYGTRAQPWYPSEIRNVNPVNAVGLVRLCQRLAARFKITELHHSGCGRPAFVGVGDCHDYGRAIDFTGVRLADPVQGKPAFLLNVQDDWSTEGVPAHAEIGQRPSLKPRRPYWEEASTPIEYRFLTLNTEFALVNDEQEKTRVLKRAIADQRITKGLTKALDSLLNQKEPASEEELKAARDPVLAEREAYVSLSRSFFQFFYDWAAENYSFASATPDPADDQAPDFPGRIGPPSPPKEMGKGGFIMHPDHQTSATDSSGREAHKAHYHIQIGPTRGAIGREPVVKKEDVPTD